MPAFRRALGGEVRREGRLDHVWADGGARWRSAAKVRLRERRLAETIARAGGEMRTMTH